ncbi:MAG: hypothetical protein KKB02_10625 [Alphaproteobacteria bacterium]|nr:hypothetical protein [Alphaproteobacteria bacterium]
MNLYVSTKDTAVVLDISTADYRAIRRRLKPSLPIQRGRKTGSGRTPDYTELNTTCRWLDHILPHGLSPDQARKLADRATTLN